MRGWTGITVADGPEVSPVKAKQSRTVIGSNIDNYAGLILDAVRGLRADC